MSDAENRKLSDLRVVDLRSELEKRGLDKTGNKQVLLERLQKALWDEGLDPDTYQFGKTPIKRLSSSSNQINSKDQGNEDEGDEENVDHSEDSAKNKTNGLNEDDQASDVKDSVAKEDTKIENKNSEKLDASVESDNMIQLTLEEEESFQDEEIDNGPDVKSNTDADKPEKEDTKNASNKNQDTAKVLADNSQKTPDKKQEGNLSTDGASGTKSPTKAKRDYSQSRNLWITNIAQTTRATELKQALSAHGKVSGAKVVINAKYPGACCYGYVTMDTAEDADNCIAKLNNTELNGHIIRIEKVRPDHMNSAKFRNDISKEKKSSSISNKSPRSKSQDIKDEKKESEKDSKTEERKEDAQKSEGKRAEPKRESRSRGRSDDKYFHVKPISSKHDRDILTFDKIKEERERQRYRERERVLREESRRRREETARQRDIERMQRSEAARLDREREKLRMEREKLERDKAEIIRLERERQRVEREKLELEKLELQRVKMRLQEEDRRSVKRPSSYRRDESYEERKRMANERRYEDSSQMRFDQTSGVKAPSPSKKFGSSSTKSRVVYDKRESYPKRDREFETDRSHTQSSLPRGPPTTITKYEGSSVFSIGRERDLHDARPREAPPVQNSRMGKDTRYIDREREPHYRPIREDRDRRPMSDHKSSREHRYPEPSKEPQRFDRNSGGSESWGHPSPNKFNQSGGSGMSSKPWGKESWRPVDTTNSSDRWSVSNMGRGLPMSASNFQGNSAMNLGPSCPPPPAINSYGGDYKSMSNIRKY